ncbi:hypothetical protein BD410DRAFT_587512 [Rickenella mellea]|uniref:F-box domain-containing protein n=1 Tax=Rickenella mellea TaxID=50990 RepID=A0A4Y7PNG1_9AGAM|nr:hypothetical protein BD410DRAFT_587512 [Rickenella mellea]
MAENAVNVVASALQRTPADVLQMIFLFCLPKPKYPGHVTFPRPSTCKAPVVYSHICRSWRDVALSTPRLWACLSIPEEFSSSFVVWIKELLRRSDSLPLYFQWTRSRKYRQNSRERDTLDQTLIKLLIAESSRWRAASIGSTSAILKQFLVPLKFGVPMLEALKIRETSPGGRFSHIYALDITAVPHLQYLNVTNECQLTGLSAKQSLRQFILKDDGRDSSDWSESFMTPSGILQLFSDCPQLELVDIDIEWDIQPTPHQAFMPSLQTLSVGPGSTYTIGPGNPIDIGPPLFQRLTLPALRTLSIDLSSEGWGRRSLVSIHSLIGRSHASLTSLSLYGQRDRQTKWEDDLIGCILHLPDLKVLSLEDMPTTDKFIIALTYSPHSTGADILCPVLDQLRFVASTFSERKVIDMIRSRWDNAKHPLLLVRFLSCKLSPSGGADLQSFGKSKLAKERKLTLMVDIRGASKKIIPSKPY